MITYKPMEDNDLRQLYEFAAPIWKECYAEILPAGQIDLLTHKYFDYENALAIQAGGMLYEYVLLDGETAGFTAYSLQPDHVYLDKLYLKSEFRGKHISSAVFDDLIAKYNLPIRLNVNQGNTLGMRAYLGRGFKIIETIDIPLPNGYVNRDYIMEKPVK
ncbi:MAG: GNAT family N-acetyltransferase [Clostridia bacterium]|nr:GNAT family N-acetyltransferase [Clostridia bacterium]